MKTVESFLNYCRDIKEYSENTVRGYKNDLDMFFDYMKENKPVNMIEERYIQSITLDDLYGFLNYLKNERDNQASSRARKIATLKSYFNYLQYKKKIIKDNPTLELDTPKLTHKEPVALTLNEALELLNKDCGRNIVRNKCILITFLNTGLRLHELCNMKINDIQGDSFKFIGKGNKERTVPLSESVKKSIEEYLQVRKAKTDYLFISERGGQISKIQVERIMNQFLSQLESDKKITTHGLRKTYATLLYNAGTPIATIGKLLGHSSLNTTMIYLGITSKDLAEANNNNPLANIY